jgi:hypothetical protein
MVRKNTYILLTMGLVGWLGFVFFRPAEVRSQGAAPANDESQFQIVVGLKDDQPKQWSGKLDVTGAEIAGVDGWRFSPAGKVEPGGKFQFETKVGPLENQLLSGTEYGQSDWNDPRIKRLIPAGLVLRLKGSGTARVRFESSSGSFEFRAEQVPFGKRLDVLNGNGRVERLPVEQKVSGDGKTDDYPALAVTRDGTCWTAWLAYEAGADEVVVNGGGKTYKLTGKGDHHAPALAVDGKGRVWVAWSQNDGGTFNLYASSFLGYLGDARKTLTPPFNPNAAVPDVFGPDQWTTPEKLSASTGNNIWPRLVSDGKDNLALVWQGFREGRSVILARRWMGGAWDAETQISESNGNSWAPSAAFGRGKLWISWDSYATGAYQVYARAYGEPVMRITRGENFSVRPSIAVTPAGVPVVAWEESDALWGKDFAFLFDRRGTTIYKNRRIRVAYLEGRDWKEIAAPVSGAVPADIRRFVQQPELATDSEGRLYLAFRVRTSAGTSRIDYWANNGQWETFVTWFQGDRWAQAVRMPRSVGRNSMRPALVLQNGLAHIAWPTDNRKWPGVKYGSLEIYATTLAANAEAAPLRDGKPLAAAPAPVSNPHPNENDDTRRARAYRYKLNGKEYRILRGDLHRHTELSNDGAGDGMLDDLYRYTLDAAAMDYAHVGDHQMGNDEEYSWWITQKSNDLYNMPQRFVVLYGYERSVWYPNGHRNVVWAERGKPVLKIGPPEAKGTASSGPIIYPYLKATDGICTSHSSATDQGTDWRDNNPELEPIVEIYQGFESNYEHEGAPRAWKPGTRAVHQGQRPDGFVWKAWAKGYKLGVQSSSDHVSTHDSYACILAENFTRQGLVDAMRKRHTYAATDSIVLDYRIATGDNGDFLMGDICATKSYPKLLVKVQGTAPIKEIQVIKNNTYIHKVTPGGKDASFEYVDRAIGGGENYYYVRVEQTDGNLAWSSPIWVTYRK